MKLASEHAASALFVLDPLTPLVSFVAIYIGNIISSP